MAVVVGIIFGVAAERMSLGITVGLIIIIVGVPFVWLWYQSTYKKESYEIFDKKIIHRSGTPFSDKETELIIKNITHVKMGLPFIEHKLFKTGFVKIESAGSKESEVHMSAVDNPGQYYELIQQMMRQSGFSLDKSQLAMTEKPHPLGVFFEVFKNFILSLLAVIYIGSSYLEDSEITWQQFIADYGSWVWPVVAVVVIVAAIWQIFVFLDLSRRIYSIYGSVIEYKEGYLAMERQPGKV